MADDYDEAEWWIAEAKASGATKLSLIGLDIGRLPESLGTLTGLQQLDLGLCRQLTDVSGLSTLAACSSSICTIPWHCPLPPEICH